MATRKCPNGHQYDASIYGDQCPFCPSKPTKIIAGPPHTNGYMDGEETVIHDKEQTSSKSQQQNSNEGRTVIRTKDNGNIPDHNSFEEHAVMYGPPITYESPNHDSNDDLGGGHTVIKEKKAAKPAVETRRRLVGLLVSYDANPSGEVYKLYEGRNVIGRSAGANISFPSDNFMSSQHLVILYKDGAFEAIDLNSSNHSYLNGNMFDETYLRINDVLTIGNTKLLFFPIPRI